MRTLLCLFLVLIGPAFTYAKSNHTSNWAVIVSSSRYWFNYRHNANALSIYHILKQRGIPDSNILLMLAEDVACDPRNVLPATVYNSANHRVNLYRDDDVSVDYRGPEVTVENLVRLLTGRHHVDTPRSKRLLSDENSNILIFLAGHGADGFLKFQDDEILSSQDLADALEQMYQQRRYGKVLLMLETCQASTLAEQLISPNIIAIGSSARGESSYSHGVDFQLGNTIIDRFTYYTLSFFESQKRMETEYLLQQQDIRRRALSHVGATWRPPTPRSGVNFKSLADLFSTYSPHLLGAHAIPRTDLLLPPATTRDISVYDFFAAASSPLIRIETLYPTLNFDWSQTATADTLRTDEASSANGKNMTSQHRSATATLHVRSTSLQTSTRLTIFTALSTLVTLILLAHSM